MAQTDVSTEKPFLLPDAILTDAEITKIKAITNEKDQELARTWWSLHDIMNYFHSGLIPISNNANMFKFKIDLSKKNFDIASYPTLKSEIENKVVNKYSETVLQIKKDMAQMTQDCTSKLAQTSNRSSIVLGQAGGDPGDEFTADGFADKCLDSIASLDINSFERVIIITGNPLPVTDEYKDKVLTPEMIKERRDKIAAAAAPTSGGNRRKTRKGRKSYKKKKVSKTHRRYRR